MDDDTKRVEAVGKWVGGNGVGGWMGGRAGGRACMCVCACMCGKGSGVWCWGGGESRIFAHVRLNSLKTIEKKGKIRFSE